LLTADGGTLIWISSAQEGYRNYPHLPEHIGSSLEDLEKLLAARLAADPLSAATGLMIGRMKERIQIVLVSEGLSRADADRMGVSYSADVETAIKAAVTHLAPAERANCVAVAPLAGVVLPLFSKESLC
jgi:hypothetical protein